MSPVNNSPGQSSAGPTTPDRLLTRHCSFQTRENEAEGRRLSAGFLGFLQPPSSSSLSMNSSYVIKYFISLFHHMDSCGSDLQSCQCFQSVNCFLTYLITFLVILDIEMCNWALFLNSTKSFNNSGIFEKANH